MKIELSKEDANSIGALLVALKHARFYDQDKLAITGGELIVLYSHIDKVYKVRERILNAENGGIGTAKEVTPPVTEEKVEKGKEKK